MIVELLGGISELDLDALLGIGTSEIGVLKNLGNI
jgi:hypothetical protein